MRVYGLKLAFFEEYFRNGIGARVIDIDGISAIGRHIGHYTRAKTSRDRTEGGIKLPLAQSEPDQVDNPERFCNAALGLDELAALPECLCGF